MIFCRLLHVYFIKGYLFFFNYSTESSYRNLDFENDMFPLVQPGSLESVEYVQMMGDVLRMKKNLCLCRNFSKLKKDAKM